MKKSQVVYNEEAKVGYLYLTSELASSQEKVDQTVELDDSIHILLDFNQQHKLIGIEFLFGVAERIKPLKGHNHVFVKKYLETDCFFYSLRVDRSEIKRKIWLKGHKIVFLFSDHNPEGFLGIDIYDVGAYSEEYLVGFS
jgi:uncharacterized protein YuzE